MGRGQKPLSLLLISFVRAWVWVGWLKLLFPPLPHLPPPPSFYISSTFSSRVNDIVSEHPNVQTGTENLIISKCKAKVSAGRQWLQACKCKQAFFLGLFVSHCSVFKAIFRLYAAKSDLFLVSDLLIFVDCPHCYLQVIEWDLPVGTSQTCLHGLL